MTSQNTWEDCPVCAQLSAAKTERPNPNQKMSRDEHQPQRKEITRLEPIQQ